MLSNYHRIQVIRVQQMPTIRELSEQLASESLALTLAISRMHEFWDDPIQARYQSQFLDAFPGHVLEFIQSLEAIQQALSIAERDSSE